MNGVRGAFVPVAWGFARAEPPVAATSPRPAAADTLDLRTFRLCIPPSCGNSKSFFYSSRLFRREINESGDYLQLVAGDHAEVHAARQRRGAFGAEFPGE